MILFPELLLPIYISKEIEMIDRQTDKISIEIDNLYLCVTNLENNP